MAKQGTSLAQTIHLANGLRYVIILDSSLQDLIDFIVFSDNNNSNQLQTRDLGGNSQNHLSIHPNCII